MKSGDLAVESGAGIGPVPLGGAHGEVQGGCGLDGGEAGKIACLNDYENCGGRIAPLPGAGLLGVSALILNGRKYCSLKRPPKQ